MRDVPDCSAAGPTRAKPRRRTPGTGLADCSSNARARHSLAQPRCTTVRSHAEDPRDPEGIDPSPFCSNLVELTGRFHADDGAIAGSYRTGTDAGWPARLQRVAGTDRGHIAGAR